MSKSVFFLHLLPEETLQVTQSLQVSVERITESLTYSETLKAVRVEKESVEDVSVTSTQTDVTIVQQITEVEN